MLGIKLKSLGILLSSSTSDPLLWHDCIDGWLVLVVVVVGLCFSAPCILGKCSVTEPHPSPHLPFCQEGSVGCSFVRVSRGMLAVYFVWKMPCVQNPRLCSLLAGKPEVCMPGLWQVLVAGERLDGPVP